MPAAKQNEASGAAGTRALLVALLAAVARGEMERFWSEKGEVATTAWGAIVALAEQCRVAALLGGTLAEDPRVPAAARHRLAGARRLVAAKNLLYWHELEALAALAAREAVPLIVLKGVALVETYYRDLGARPMSDIDLLVRRRDSTRARALLERAGFCIHRREPRPGAMSVWENSEARRKRGLIPVLIGLHWDLFDSPHHQGRIDEDWLWQGARTLRIGATPLGALSLEAQLLHLCGHLELHHGGDDPLRLFDIALLLRADGDRIDWRTLGERAAASDLVTPLHAVLHRLEREWGVTLPGAARAVLATLRPSPAERTAMTWLTGDRGAAGRRFVADLSLMSGWRTRLTFALTHLFPSVEYMRKRYEIGHRLLVPFYYPVRWWRGLRSLGSSGGTRQP